MSQFKKKIEDLITELEDDGVESNVVRINGIRFPGRILQYAKNLHRENISLLRQVVANIESGNEWITSQACQALSFDEHENIIDQLDTYFDELTDGSGEEPNNLNPKDWASVWLMVVGLQTVLEENNSK